MDSLHGIDQATGTHVSPVSLDVVDAGLARVGPEARRPAGRRFNSARPQRVLAFVVDKHTKLATLVLEWIGHLGAPSSVGDLGTPARSSAAASNGPIDIRAAGLIILSCRQEMSCTSMLPRM